MEKPKHWLCWRVARTCTLSKQKQRLQPKIPHAETMKKVKKILLAMLAVCQSHSA